MNHQSQYFVSVSASMFLEGEVSASLHASNGSNAGAAAATGSVTQQS